jgi:hypothetical protein
MSFVLSYGLINFLFFNYSFYVCLFVLYVLLSVLCVLCFCIFLLIVSLHAYSLFSIGVQIYLPLPPAGNLIAVNKYHIISYITKKTGNVLCNVVLRCGRVTIITV